MQNNVSMFDASYAYLNQNLKHCTKVTFYPLANFISIISVCPY